MRFLLHNETKDETGWCMLDDLEKAEGWAELSYDEQTERIRTAFDAQLQRDKAEDPRRALANLEKKGWKALCKHGDCKRQCLGHEEFKAPPRVVDKDGNLVFLVRCCGEHGGRSAGHTPALTCFHPGCSKRSAGTKITNPIGKKPENWWYCDTKCLAADAARVALFEKILTKLGQDDTTVKAKLADLDEKQQPGTPTEALAQLNTILAADNVLQALQDALDAGPSGAGGA